MNVRGKGVLLAVGALGAVLAGAVPALAQGHGGGGGGHFSGGGHSFSGHAGGFGASHLAAGSHYGGTAGHVYGGAAPAYHTGYQGRPGAGYAGRSGYTGYPGAGAYGYGHGYSTGAYWHGGYWNGGFWPRAYYGVGYSWFLPVLPLAYSTYWWGGEPYYYANDVYYTYDPNYQGYIATDPPPVADPSGAAAPSSDSNAPPADAPQSADGQQAPAQQPPPNGASQNGALDGAPSQIFMYPKNGQSAEQTSTDRSECQQWATEQAGSVAQNGPNYNRAMVACIEGRGYSAR